jgi:hypothetical protein
MKYMIRIQAINEVKFKKSEYQRIADSGNERDGGTLYGYVEAPEQVKEEATTVYEQVVSDPHASFLWDVIAAANGNS